MQFTYPQLTLRRPLLLLVLISLLLMGCGRRSEPRASVGATMTATPQPTITTPSPPPTKALKNRLVEPADRTQQLAAIPLLATRTARLDAVLDDPSRPALALPDEALTRPQQEAQALALADARFVRFTVHPQSGDPLRSEIFSVEPTRPSDVTEETAACMEADCYRVVMYNYALNTTSVATVNVDTGLVLDAGHLPDSQPELTPELTELALQIALNAPAVEEELGFTPDSAGMANVKTALNNSACESSRHLCVAPTIIVGERALWAIVDLTDEQLVGLRWTDLGDFSGGRPTQDLIAREDIFENYCNTLNHLDQDGWELDYILTSSDGLRISDVRFQGEPVWESVKVVDFHVSYSTREGFGYSDAVGCPMFSSSAVIATTAPTIEPLIEGGEQVGFSLFQDFANPLWPAPCNYRYSQRYDFYRDGSFRPVVTNLGRGCGNDGIYRPILRLQPAKQDGGHQFAEWSGADWAVWDDEDWQLQDEATAYTDEGFQYRISTADGRGYYLEPGRGQFPDNRGDQAYTYVSVANSAEGESDLVTIGACCNQDHRQGPHAFVEEPAEPLAGENLVIWYVPQIENDDTPGQEFCWADLTVENGLMAPQIWPCSAGPRFVPLDAIP